MEKRRIVTLKTRDRKKGPPKEGGPLTAKLGDFIPQLAVMKIEDPIIAGVEALKVAIGGWKSKVRHAITIAKYNAAQAVMHQEALVDALKTKGGTRRGLEEAERKLEQLAGMATELEDRTDWVWRDEIEDTLTDGERAFIGMFKDEAGVWRGGYWLWDYETRDTEKAPEQSRSYVSFEFLDRCCARKMFQLEDAIEGKGRNKQLVIVQAFIDEWSIGRPNPYIPDEED